MHLTEDEWLNATEPFVVLCRRQWPRKTTGRKLWLFTAACLRLLPARTASRKVLEAIERFADLPGEEQTQEEFEAIGEAALWVGGVGGTEADPIYSDPESVARWATY